MASLYPSSKQTFTNPQPSDRLNNPSHSDLHRLINSALEAIQDAVGYTGQRGGLNLMTGVYDNEIKSLITLI